MTTTQRMWMGLGMAAAFASVLSMPVRAQAQAADTEAPAPYPPCIAPEPTPISGAESLPPPPPPPTPPGYVPPPPPPAPTVACDMDQPSADVGALELAPPRYPEDAICSGAYGEVRLRLSIDAHGNLLNVAVNRSSRNRSLDRAAMDAARRWRFHAGLYHGIPVGGDVIVPVNFQPPGPPPAYCALPVHVKAIFAGTPPRLLEADDTPTFRSPTGMELVVQYTLLDSRESGQPLEAIWYYYGKRGDKPRVEVARANAALTGGGLRRQAFAPVPAGGWVTGEYIVQLQLGTQVREIRRFRVRD
jgi:protein TonB